MLWEEIIREAENVDARVRNVYQEEMQKAVLAGLARKRSFERVVFQGGTALRLFYRNPRFSEDIDLVLAEGVEEHDLSSSMSYVKDYCEDRFPFLESVGVGTQKRTKELQRYVLKALSDAPEQRLRLHIELASVPSYQNSPRILDFPPLRPAILVEDPIEILADKICALALRRYLKGRDLWDIYFLTKELSEQPRWDLVARKVEDYGYRSSYFCQGLKDANRKIESEGESILEGELRRFLPEQILTRYRSSYRKILDSVLEITADVDTELEAGGIDEDR